MQQLGGLHVSKQPGLGELQLYGGRQYHHVKTHEATLQSHQALDYLQGHALGDTPHARAWCEQADNFKQFSNHILQRSC